MINKVLILIAFGWFGAASDLNKNVQSDYESLAGEIVQLLIDGRKDDFLLSYAPTKEGLLEFSYKTPHDQISKREKKGFYEGVNPTLVLLQAELSSSFDFVMNKMQDKGIKKLERIEIAAINDKMIGDTATKTLHFTVFDQDMAFKIEILGLYKTSKGWMIMSDIAPGYF